MIDSLLRLFTTTCDWCYRVNLRGRACRGCRRREREEAETQLWSEAFMRRDR